MSNRTSISWMLVLGMVGGAHAVDLRGKISNQAGKPVANAIVTLTPLGLKDTTGADGMYSIASSASILPSRIGGQPVSFRNGILEVSLDRPVPVKLEIFDTKGASLNREVFQSAASGIYHVDFAKMALGTGICLIKVTVDRSSTTFRYAPMNGSGSDPVGSNSITPKRAFLARGAAVTDSIKVAASGYKSKTVVATSLTSTIDVRLDTNASSDRWGGLKNAPVKSAGCGKALGTINKSGTYKISSAGGRGEYIINLPANYDKDKPYQLVFGNHCMGGSAPKVAAADNGDDLSGFYSIKTLADKDNIPGIYVALQGNGDGTWNSPNDLKFWADVLNQVESNLCVDTTRVFVAGFSFGAMFSYALSLEYPERIRAVATYAPANWNFNQPTNRKIPVAYYQVTGTNDDLCKWIHNDGLKQGGKYCLMKHVQDNGCTGEPKIATGSAHVTTDFTGCKEGYPVKFGSFVGGHQAVHSDPGSRDNWIEKETWEFFKQF